jgi:uncharacterized small protein (DUF1192 family)
MERGSWRGLLRKEPGHLHWQRKFAQAACEDAMDPEELEPRKPVAKLRDLEPLSVAELENYIEELKTEIRRVEAKMAAKRNHLGAAAALFKPS